MIRTRTKPRRDRVRDQAYLEWLHTQPSIVAYHDPLCIWWECCVTAHHVRRFGEQKDDRRAVPLWRCRHLHDAGRESIEHGKAAFEKRFGIDLEQEIKRLNEKYEQQNRTS